MPSYRVRSVTSLDAPELQPYRTLRRPVEHLKQGIFVAEGEKVVRRFLASNWPVVSLLVTQEWFETILPTLDEHRLDNVDVFLAEKKLLETIVGFPLHQGIMAVGRVPAERSLEEMVTRIPSPHFLVALDGLENAENVGVVVRNCAGFGVHGIVVSLTSASPYLRRAVRNSMGGIFVVPVVHVQNLASSLAGLRDHHGTNIIVADAAGERTIDEIDLRGNICIVFGNENAGVSAEVEAVATQRVRIPMDNATDSLNVASASAVMLFEARRQRK